MTHFGVICPPFAGHIHPMAALGRELQRRGHCITFLQIPDLETAVRSEGLNFWPIGKSAYRPGELAESFTELGKLSGIESLRYSVELCQRFTATMCEDAPCAIAEAGIEALLADQLEPASETVAEYLRIPFVTVSCAQAIHRKVEIPPFFTLWNYENKLWARLRNQAAYYLLDRNSQPLLQALNQYRKQWKLPVVRKLYASRSRLAHISQQPPAFDFPCANLPNHFHYVGPFRNPSPCKISFPYERLTGQPLIYASMGTLQNRQQKVFQCIAEACVGLDAQLVISLGGSSSPESWQGLPGNPLVVSYAPQLELLKKATLTITHAGMNTTLGCLTNGVPMVAIPIAHEQPGIAARIAWTGAGELVPLSRLSVPRLRGAIQRVLTQDSYKKNAIRLQEAIRRAGGVSRAVDIIEQAVSTGKPVSAQEGILSTQNSRK